MYIPVNGCEVWYIHWPTYSAVTMMLYPGNKKLRKRKEREGVDMNESEREREREIGKCTGPCKYQGYGSYLTMLIKENVL